MANLFKNPLVLAETIVGSVIDQRSVVLYEQEEFTDIKSEILSDLLSRADGTILYPTVQDFVQKRTLKELFTGMKIPYVSEINGFNVWGISYQDVSVNIESDLCDHPIETGQVVTDAAIIQPVSAELNIVMPTAFYTAIFEEVAKYYREKKKIILLTKFGVYSNMVISAMPYRLEHGTVDRPVIALKLRQIMEVYPEYEKMDIAEGGISDTEARVMDDSDTAILNQKRYTSTVGESLRKSLEATNG
ncbi:MAG: hypothetical protein J6W29_03265 [Neisseriaceae bacterium]|nr:hypothetical protein [Neisseriaceae bacterium]